MDKDENKGLADNHDGEFILNESGTSVTIDGKGEFTEDKAIIESDEQVNDNIAVEPEEAEGK